MSKASEAITLDLEASRAQNDNLLGYFESMFELFTAEGWKTLMRDMKENAFQINSVEHTTDNDNLHYRKGQLGVLAQLLNLENSIEIGYQDFLNSDTDEANGNTV
tara:strand:- start:4211 stop:4525 length:315 start_codon:yes stop_codon:yes gene_type:complete